MTQLTARLNKARRKLPIVWIAAEIIALFTFLWATPPPARAQGRFEVQPYVGYKWGGNTNVGVNPGNIQELSIDSSVAYGVTGTFNATSRFGLEFMWNRQPTNVAGDLAGGGVFPKKIGVNVDQYHGNFLISLGKDREARVVPFFLIGFGDTSISGAGSSISKFSYGLGGGVKYFFTQHIGTRFQIRYAPTYLYSTSGGIWCTWYGYCFATTDNHYLQQGDVTGGLVFRF